MKLKFAMVFLSIISGKLLASEYFLSSWTPLNSFDRLNLSSLQPVKKTGYMKYFGVIKSAKLQESVMRDKISIPFIVDDSVTCQIQAEISRAVKEGARKCVYPKLKMENIQSESKMNFPQSAYLILPCNDDEIKSFYKTQTHYWLLNVLGFPSLQAKKIDFKFTHSIPEKTTILPALLLEDALTYNSQQLNTEVLRVDAFKPFKKDETAYHYYSLYACLVGTHDEQRIFFDEQDVGFNFFNTFAIRKKEGRSKILHDFYVVYDLDSTSDLSTGNFMRCLRSKEIKNRSENKNFLKAVEVTLAKTMNVNEIVDRINWEPRELSQGYAAQLINAFRQQLCSIADSNALEKYCV